MKKPNVHPHEKERLSALKSLNILDTISEKEFDEITFIASQICETPIALISLIDESRQWFKSKVGLSVNEMSKDFSFCSHAILQDDVFLVPDSLKDERFCDNPLVTGEPRIQFYAGIPLLDPMTNLPIGTLCVIDSKPKNIGPEQIQILKGLSHQVYKLLDLRIKVADLSRAHEKLIFQKIAIDNMSEGILLHERSGKIIDHNRAALKVLGLSEDQLVGKSSKAADWQMVHEDGSIFTDAEHPAAKALATAQPQNNIVMGIQSKDSDIRWLTMNSIPIFLNNQTAPSHTVTTITDKTNEKRAQQALLQTAKMTSLGEMAGGIAHEINTPLAIILSSSKLIETCLGAVPPDIEKALPKVKKIESTVKRISQIVRGLRAFSRESGNDPWSPCSLQQIISETVALCSEKIHAGGIQLEIKVTDDFHVNAIPTQISQIVLNLLNNSYDAIIERPNKWITVALEKQDQTVCLSVTDCGDGISEDVVTKLMLPFFTTKKVGKGTGLGLSISKKIAESFNGNLCYKLRDGHTCFELLLPVSQPDAKSDAL